MISLKCMAFWEGSVFCPSEKRSQGLKVLELISLIWRRTEASFPHCHLSLHASLLQLALWCNVHLPTLLITWWYQQQSGGTSVPWRPQGKLLSSLWQHKWQWRKMGTAPAWGIMMLSIKGLRKNCTEFGIQVVSLVNLCFPANCSLQAKNLPFCTELACISSFWICTLSWSPKNCQLM